MKESYKEQKKVSLIFYSEEEGKRIMVDKWNIEIGKKYIIGRSKRKVDIIIQDSNISRVQSEIIFYDKDKIMIKDLDSSNGTFINKIKIEPRKEMYFSARDIISIGDEKNELIFEVPKEEEEKKSNYDEEKKTNENNEIKFEDINYREKNQKNIRKRKISKEPFSKDSSYKRYDNKYDKYNHRDDRDNKLIIEMIEIINMKDTIDIITETIKMINIKINQKNIQDLAPTQIQEEIQMIKIILIQEIEGAIQSQKKEDIIINIHILQEIIHQIKKKINTKMKMKKISIKIYHLI